MSLNGVNVLVAGGCGLIGYELVIQILDCGANVIVGDCNQVFRLIENLTAANHVIHSLTSLTRVLLIKQLQSA